MMRFIIWWERPPESDVRMSILQDFIEKLKELDHRPEQKSVTPEKGKYAGRTFEQLQLSSTGKTNIFVDVTDPNAVKPRSFSNTTIDDIKGWKNADEVMAEVAAVGIQKWNDRKAMRALNTVKADIVAAYICADLGVPVAKYKAMFGLGNRRAGPDVTAEADHSMDGFEAATDFTTKSPEGVPAVKRTTTPSQGM